ncbi:MAG: hypothetical protein Q9159_001325 [Coniocarpon cinnabarinum]
MTLLLRPLRLAPGRLGSQWHGSVLQSCRTAPPSLERQQVRTLFYLPTILQPAFWRSLVPSFLRRDSPGPQGSATKKPRNPATYFIWMSLLIGSQAIQLITLQRGFEHFTHETEERLALLRNVLKRVQAGEDVDVEKELGTDDPVKEKEWEHVMQELESEDAVYAERSRDRKKREAREARESGETRQSKASG